MSNRVRVLVLLLVVGLVPTVACTLYYQYQALGGATGGRSLILAAYPVALIALIGIADSWQRRRQRPWRLRLCVGLLLLAMLVLRFGPPLLGN